MDDIFTKEELADAQAFLEERQVEFWSDTYVGHKLRDNAIKQFKSEHGIKANDAAIVRVEADLANEAYISYAIDMNVEDERQNKYDIR